MIYGYKTVYHVAPASLNPTSASAAMLASLGIPERPTDTVGAALWDSIYGHPLHFAVPPPTIVADTGVSSGNKQSSNWSGYEENSGTYTYALSGWVEPTDGYTSCNPNSAVFWVGTGGDGNSHLHQAGTGQNTPGLAQDQAWSELLPEQASLIPQALYTAPGDQFDSIIHDHTNNNTTDVWMEDITTGQVVSFTSNVSGFGTGTAEQIAERPTVNGSLPGFTNFQSINFDGNYVDSGYIHNYTRSTFTMWNGSDQLTGLTGLSGPYDAFTDTHIRCG